MAEKGELPTDQVSLPPTYAPSEAYTESPPPAYKRDVTANIRIAKIICFTLLLMTFMVGSFIVVHRWVHLKECNCPDIAIKSEDVLGRPQFLVADEPQAKSLNFIENLNEEPVKENVVIEEEQPKQKDQNNNEEEAKPIDNETVIEEIKKNIKLPVDMIMGNPSLGGKDMNCNVEKRKQKIADGIFSEAVIVTCENEEKVDLPFPPKMEIKKGAPPLSLLGGIMKALLSRPRMNNEPKIIRPLFPRPSPSDELPFPVIRPLDESMSMPPNNGVLRIVPIKKVVHRYNPIPEIRELNMPKQFNFPHPLLNPMVRKIILKPQNFHEQENNENEVPPFMRPAPEQEHHHFEPETSNISPIRIMRINGNDFNEERPPFHEENSERPPFPFPFNPIMKIFPIRRARVLHVMPRPNGEYHHEENNAYEPEPRPFPHFEENHEHGIPEVPEASGRSLPSPRIAVPGGPEIKFIRLAGNPSPLLRLPGRGIVTHMEMRAPPHHPSEDEQYPPVLPVNNEEQEFGPPKTHTVIEPQEPLYRPEVPHEHFHEPEENENQFADFQNISPEEEPISIPQIQQRFFLPPPPRFRPEGRISPVAQINPDADIYTGPNHEH